MLIVVRTRNGFRRRRAPPAALRVAPPPCTSPLLPLPGTITISFSTLHISSSMPPRSSPHCVSSPRTPIRILSLLCLISVLHISFLRFIIISARFKYFSHVQELLRLPPRPQVYAVACRPRVVPVALLASPSCFPAVLPVSLLIPYTFSLTHWGSEESWTHTDPVLTSFNSSSHSITPPRRPSARPRAPAFAWSSSVLHTPRRTPAHLQ